MRESSCLPDANPADQPICRAPSPARIPNEGVAPIRLNRDHRTAEFRMSRAPPPVRDTCASGSIRGNGFTQRTQSAQRRVGGQWSDGWSMPMGGSQGKISGHKISGDGGTVPAAISSGRTGIRTMLSSSRRIQKSRIQIGSVQGSSYIIYCIHY